MNRTYDLDSMLVARIDAAAHDLGLFRSDLVAFLLDCALDLVEAGTLEVPVRPHKYAISREPA